MAAKKDKDKKPVMKPVIYLGERPNWLQKIKHDFRNEKGETLSWDRFNGIPGSVYLYDAANDRMNCKTPERDHNSKMVLTEKEETEFEAYKVVCRQIRAERSKIMQIKKVAEPIARAIKLIQPYMWALSHHEQIRFGNYIRDQASKKPKGAK